MILSSSDFKLYPMLNGMWAGQCAPGTGHYYDLDKIPQELAQKFIEKPNDERCLRKMYDYFVAHGTEHSDLDGKYQEAD